MSSSTITMKVYHMKYTTSRTNVTLHLTTPSGPCIYYAESHLLTTKPLIRLRHGDSKTSPIVSLARVALSGRHVLLASGDCTDPKNMDDPSIVWEEMRRDKITFRRSDYAFGTAVGGAEGKGQRRERKMYGWERSTRSVVSTAYECVVEDEEKGEGEGEPIAKMLSGGAFNWKHGGEIHVREGLERELEEMLILSALSIWAIEGLSGWSIVKAEEKTHSA